MKKEWIVWHNSRCVESFQSKADAINFASKIQTIDKEAAIIYEAVGMVTGEVIVDTKYSEFV